MKVKGSLNPGTLSLQGRFGVATYPYMFWTGLNVLQVFWSISDSFYSPKRRSRALGL